MLRKLFSRSPIALGLVLTLLSMSSSVALAAPQQGQAMKAAGELTVTGEVMVDGSRAVTGATLFPGSTVTTGENASAVVRVANLGRVELMPNTTMVLNFDEANLNGSLNAGRTRVATEENAAANITTKDGVVVAENTQPAVFSVDVECGNTAVATTAGLVKLQAGTEVKQVAAGQDQTMGTPAPGTRCTRLTTAGGAGIGGITGGALAALLIAAGAAIGGVVYALTSDSNDIELTPGGTTPVISPT